MISAILGALIYGISFYNREHISWVRTMVTVALVLLIVNTILNTLWVIMMGNITDPNAIMKMIEIRGLKQIMMFPIQVVLIHTILNNKSLGQLMQRVFN